MRRTSGQRAILLVGLAAGIASARPAEPPPPDTAPAPDPRPPEARPVPRVADPAPPPPARAVEPTEVPTPRQVQVHGFVSGGGFVSTSNDYIGVSSRGSLELFEVGVNFSTEVTDRLHVGIQLFARDVGKFQDDAPRVDWGFLDYRWRSWLGVRAGVIKMPFGLYNEYADIDSARLSILLPQAVYPVRNREALLAHRGLSIYGDRALGTAGGLEYQVWLGTLSIPSDALTLIGATLDDVDAKYVTGAQVFWRPPVDGLRVGGTFVRASIDFALTLDPSVVEQLIMLELVPPTYQGELVVSQRPDSFAIVSAEYSRGTWAFAAEYMRAQKHQQTSLPAVVPAIDEDHELCYAMASHQVSPRLGVGAYYSVEHADAADRRGHDPKYAANHQAWQRDLAASVRFDITDHWLWKLEAHFIDGTAAVPMATNPHPDRYWALFLFKTTLTF